MGAIIPYKSPLVNLLEEPASSSSRRVNLQSTSNILKSFIPAFQIQEPKFFVSARNYEKIDVNALKLVLQNEKLKQHADLKVFVEDYLEDGVFKKIFNLINQSLHQVLPQVVLNNCITSFFTQIYHYINIIGFIKLPLSTLGTDRLALLTRSHELEERKEDYKERLNNYLIILINEINSGSFFDKEDFAKEKAYLESEKIKIKKEEYKIRIEYFKYLLGVAKYFVSNLGSIIPFTPFKNLIEIGLIISKAGIIEILNLGLAFLNLNDVKNKENIYQNFEEKFKELHTKPALEKEERIRYVKSQSPLINAEELENFAWNEIFAHFESFRAEEDARLSTVIEQSRSLVEKRQAEKDKKVLQLAMQPDIQDKLRDHFIKMNETKSEEELMEWFALQSPISLLNLYVDQQSTIEATTISAFNQMIDKKLELEKQFVGLQSSQVRAAFWLSFITLGVVLTGGIISLVVNPVGMAGLLTGLTVVSIIFGLSFWITNYLMGSKYKSHSSGFLNFKIMIASIRYEISNYWLKLQKKELLMKDPSALPVIKSEKTTATHLEGINEQEIANFFKQRTKTRNLLIKLENLREQRRNKEWVDFKNYIWRGEENGYNYNLIQGLKEGLNLIDFDLINVESKHTLEFGLGFSLPEMHKELKNDQLEVGQDALRVIEKDLLTLFNSNNEDYNSFMDYQLQRWQ